MDTITVQCISVDFTCQPTKQPTNQFNQPTNRPNQLLILLYVSIYEDG